MAGLAGGALSDLILPGTGGNSSYPGLQGPPLWQTECVTVKLISDVTVFHCIPCSNFASKS